MDTVLTIFGVAGLVACATGWTLVGARWAGGKSVFPVTPHRPVPWGGVEILVTVLILFVLQGFLSAAIRTVMGIEFDARREQMPVGAAGAVFLVSAVGSLLTLALSAIAVRLRTGATWDDLGFSSRFLAADLRLGCIAFLLIVPPVYLIQLALVQWFPSEHPLATFLKENPDGRVLAICLFSAVIVAPLTEEYFFRVLFQGWLERLAKTSCEPQSAETLGNATQLDTLNGEDGRDLSNPYVAPAPESRDANAQAAAEDLPLPAGGAMRRSLPIVASAAFFAIMHWSHGPDPIPLGVLALGLGVLYQRTHRITPGIVVHFGLNATSMVLLLVEISRGS